MATVPAKDEPVPSRVARAKAVVARPDYRIPVLLAAAAAAGALAPFPLGSLVAACLVLVAADRKR